MNYPIILFFLLGISLSVDSQTDPLEILLGDSISAEIQGNEGHFYSLSLTENQFVRVILNQDGVDVHAVLTGPDGTKIDDFDSPNGSYGPELITLMASKPGIYTLEVIPFLQNAPLGNYQLFIDRLEPFGSTKAKQIDQIMSKWDTNDTPGASVAIVHNGAIVFSKGYGISNLEYGIPINTESVFHTASISKQVTALAIMLLVEENKLSLDDDIREYIPEVPDFGKTITLRHLANHTSGLRDQWSLLVMAGWRMDDVITTKHILGLVEQQKELNFSPGEQFLYSNTGFTLLAEVVSRVSGMSFSEFTRRRIFNPLHMENTQFYDDHEKLVANRVYSYEQGGAGYKKSVLNYATAGATSLFTTPEDLTNWVINFDRLIVGSKETMIEMHKKGILRNGDSTDYALGQSVGVYNGLYNVRHGGADAGYRTFISRFPEQDFAVVIFGNDASFDPSRIAYQLTDLYLGDQYIEESIDVKPKKVVAYKEKIDKSLLRSYCGDYELEPNFHLSVTFEFGKLMGTLNKLRKFVLIPVSPAKFVLSGEDTKVSFHPIDGTCNLLKLHQSGAVLVGERVELFDLTTLKNVDFTGKYYSEELKTNYTLIEVDGKLIMTHPRLDQFEIKPSKRDLFISSYWAFSTVKFSRNEADEITEFRASNGRVQNLLFERIE
ncbi:MAG: CubicO group peptidase (beta-lactamase class C family) [Flavobacteriaceae bacterium]|jgi:CubicO group peptidase (beta-lactamase class C family)